MKIREGGRPKVSITQNKTDLEDRMRQLDYSQVLTG